MLCPGLKHFIQFMPQFIMIISMFSGEKSEPNRGYVPQIVNVGIWADLRGSCLVHIYLISTRVFNCTYLFNAANGQRMFIF